MPRSQGVVRTLQGVEGDVGFEDGREKEHLSPYVMRGVLKKRGWFHYMWTEYDVGVNANSAQLVLHSAKTGKKKKAIPLFECSVWAADKEVNRRRTFQVYHPDRGTHYFMANSDEEFRNWLEGMQKLIGGMRPVDEGFHECDCDIQHRYVMNRPGRGGRMAYD